MKIFSLLTIFLIASFSFASSLDFSDLIGDTKKETTESSDTAQGGTPAQKKVSWKLTTAPVKPLVPASISELNTFHPALDAMDFTNFASAEVVDGKIIRSKDVNGGTCWGISYFTSIWFSRVTKHYMQKKITNPHRKFESDSLTWKTAKLLKDGLGTPYEEIDGVNYALSEVKPEEFKGDYKTLMDKFRLDKFSSRYGTEVKLGAISHHSDQFYFPKHKIDVKNPQKLAAGMETLKKSLMDHGPVIIGYEKYIVSDKWYQWNKWKSGHAILLYRISEVEAETDGKKYKAWKLDYADPNINYRTKKSATDAEGYGSYYLYFPTLKKLVMSEKAKSMYNTQHLNSFDGEELVFFYNDCYEGHPRQETLAKARYAIKNQVGKGAVLSFEQAAAAKKTSKIKLE